jgi:hypothetical protein
MPYNKNNLERGMDMKLTDMIVSALLKRGVMWEARAIEATIEIPGLEKLAIIKIENMTIKLDKDKQAEA